MGWYIFLAVLIFLSMLLMVSVKIRLKLNDELEVWLTVCIFRKKLYPSPEKKRRIKLKDYSPKALEKKLKKEKIKEKKHKKNKTPASKRKSAKDTIRMVKLIAKMSIIILNKCRKYVTIRIKRLYIAIASDDAAKTAVLYGCVSQCVAYLLEILSSATSVKETENSTNVTVDFGCEETYTDIDIIFSIHLWQIIALFATAVTLFFKENIINEKKNTK